MFRKSRYFILTYSQHLIFVHLDLNSYTCIVLPIQYLQHSFLFCILFFLQFIFHFFNSFFGVQKIILTTLKFGYKFPFNMFGIYIDNINYSNLSLDYIICLKYFICVLHYFYIRYIIVH